MEEKDSEREKVEEFSKITMKVETELDSAKFLSMYPSDAKSTVFILLLKPFQFPFLPCIVEVYVSVYKIRLQLNQFPSNNSSHITSTLIRK